MLRQVVEDLRDVLDIPRREMPQIRGEQIPSLLKFSSESGIPWEKESVSVTDLSLTQKDLNAKKVASMAQEPLSQLTKYPLLVSYEFQILDGHHRWAAIKKLNPDQVVVVIRFLAPITDCINMAKNFVSTQVSTPH